MFPKLLDKKILAVIIAIVAIIAIAVACYFLLMPKEIVFASTQLNPTNERAFAEGTLLKEFKDKTGITVKFVPITYDDLAARLEAEMKAGNATISVIGDIHGDLDLFVSKNYLMDLSKFGTLPDRTFPAILESYSKIRGIKAYVPWMTATYVFVVNKKAFDYLPGGLTKEDVIKGTNKWTYDALLAWAKNIYGKTEKRS